MSACRRHRLLFDADHGHLLTSAKAKPLDVDWTSKTTSPSVAQACEGASVPNELIVQLFRGEASLFH